LLALFMASQNSPSLVYVSVGDGTTSEGEFWEAMNSASEATLRRSRPLATAACPWGSTG